MSKLSRFWDWLLPGLICLCPMGAVAYYTAGAEHAVPVQDPANTGWRNFVFQPRMGTADVSIARS